MRDFAVDPNARPGHEGFESLEFPGEARDRSNRTSRPESLDRLASRRLGGLNAAVDGLLHFLTKVQRLFDAKPAPVDQPGGDGLGLLAGAIREVFDGGGRRCRSGCFGSTGQTEQRLHQACGKGPGPPLDQVDQGLGQDSRGGILATWVLDHLDRVARDQKGHDVGQRDVSLHGGVVELPVGVAGDEALHGTEAT